MQHLPINAQQSNLLGVPAHLGGPDAMETDNSHGAIATPHTTNIASAPRQLIASNEELQAKWSQVQKENTRMSLLLEKVLEERASLAVSNANMKNQLVALRNALITTQDQLKEAQKKMAEEEAVKAHVRGALEQFDRMAGVVPLQ